MKVTCCAAAGAAAMATATAIRVFCSFINPPRKKRF
jgi:hypothetical protein